MKQYFIILFLNCLIYGACQLFDSYDVSIWRESCIFIFETLYNKELKLNMTKKCMIKPSQIIWKVQQHLNSLNTQVL